jgi:deazaflavin-dependent oxidoreductase (nitroreductase family)
MQLLAEHRLGAGYSTEDEPPPREQENAMPLYGKEHIERYEATDGAEGHDWVNGTTVLLLHTTGRKSGRDYTHPLIYREHDGDYLIVASKGGAPEPPEWFLNLQANPEVTVQVKGDQFAARARTATSEEKPELWKLMAEVWPDYDEYQRKTDREIPVVVLERT